MTWVMVAFGALCGAGFVTLVASDLLADRCYRQGYDHGYTDGRHEQANATPYPTHHR